MTYQQARREIDAAYRRGDIDRDTWEVERNALEYAHEQAQSAQDDEMGVTE